MPIPTIINISRPKNKTRRVRESVHDPSCQFRTNKKGNMKRIMFILVVLCVDSKPTETALCRGPTFQYTLSYEANTTILLPRDTVLKNQSAVHSRVFH